MKKGTKVTSVDLATPEHLKISVDRAGKGPAVVQIMRAVGFKMDQSKLSNFVTGKAFDTPGDRRMGCYLAEVVGLEFEDLGLDESDLLPVDRGRSGVKKLVRQYREQVVSTSPWNPILGDHTTDQREDWGPPRLIYSAAGGHQIKERRRVPRERRRNRHPVAA